MDTSQLACQVKNSSFKHHQELVMWFWEDGLNLPSAAAPPAPVWHKKNESEVTTERKTRHHPADSSLDCLLSNPTAMAQTQGTQRLIQNLTANFFMPASWNESVQSKKVGLPPFFCFQLSLKNSLLFNISVFLTSFISSHLKLKLIHASTQRQVETTKQFHTYIQVLRGLYCIVTSSCSTLKVEPRAGRLHLAAFFLFFYIFLKDTRDEFTARDEPTSLNLLLKKRKIIKSNKMRLEVYHSVQSKKNKEPLLRLLSKRKWFTLEGAGRGQRHRSLLLPPM